MVGGLPGVADPGSAGGFLPVPGVLGDVLELGGVLEVPGEVLDVPGDVLDEPRDPPPVTDLSASDERPVSLALPLLGGVDVLGEVPVLGAPLRALPPEIKDERVFASSSPVADMPSACW